MFNIPTEFYPTAMATISLSERSAFKLMQQLEMHVNTHCWQCGKEGNPQNGTLVQAPGQQGLYCPACAENLRALVIDCEVPTTTNDNQ